MPTRNPVSLQALVESGARVDNVFFAAGLGDLERVRGFCRPDGKLGPESLGNYLPPFDKERPGTPESIAQEALHFAVTHGSDEVARFLLERGAEANGPVEGHLCRLPLMQTLLVEQFAMVRLLLEHGADPELVDPQRGVTPLEHALEHDQSEIIDELRRARG